MNKANRLMLFGLVALILLVATISAEQISDGTFSQRIMVTGGSEVNMTDGTFSTSAILGGIFGQTNGDNFKTFLGFYHASGEDDSPGWNGNLTNVTSAATRLSNVYFAVNVSDNVSLANAMFSWNGTSSRWENDTPIGLSGKVQIVNVTKQINLTRDNTFCWTFYINDTLHQQIKTDTWCSIVNNSVPTTPTLLAPTNDDVLFDRTPEFNWSTSFDADLESITYQILALREECQDGAKCVTPKVNVTGITQPNQSITAILDVDSVYNWTVRASDAQTSSPYAQTRNFSTQSLISLSLPVSSVDFGSMSIGQLDNTTDDSPPPLTVQNDGNVLTNISIRANVSLWQSIPLNTSYFMFAVNETSETGAFDTAGSTTSFTNITSYYYPAIKELNFSDAKDLAEINIYVNVPQDESAGTRYAGLNIRGQRSP